MQKGKIYSFTIVYSSTEALKDKTPYLAAIVEKSNGEKVSTILDGCPADVKIGAEVAFSHYDSGGCPIYKMMA